jgi:two-component system OmpR family sensor kinase
MRLSTQISILFGLSLALMLAIAIFIERSAADKNRQLIKRRYFEAARELIKPLAQKNDARLSQLAKSLGLRQVEAVAGEAVAQKDLLFGKVEIIEQDGRLYLRLGYLGKEATFYDSAQDHYAKELLLARLLIAADVAILALIYLLILRLTAPIKELSAAARRIGEGELDTALAPKGSLELQSLANEFNEMARRIRRLVGDQQSLLRYVGHELKTPLAKARFQIERGDLEATKRALSQIEAITQKILHYHTLSTATPQKSRFGSDTLLLGALELCHIADENRIKIEGEPFEIEGDAELLAVALKNLIENGLIHSSGPVTIRAARCRIEVVSEGPPVEAKKGLGLSIIHEILRLHGLGLSYRHEDGKNIYGVRF